MLSFLSRFFRRRPSGKPTKPASRRLIGGGSAALVNSGNRREEAFKKIEEPARQQKKRRQRQAQEYREKFLALQAEIGQQGLKELLPSEFCLTTAEVEEVIKAQDWAYLARLEVVVRERLELEIVEWWKTAQEISLQSLFAELVRCGRFDEAIALIKRHYQD